jgi:integrating conjugative element relaxase (TIGR03760 family)
MGWKLSWKKVKGAAVTEDTGPEPGAFRAEPAAVLLSTPRRRRLIEHIWQRTSLSREQFERLYLDAINRYAELVQQLPASQNHHHAYPGGMLDHGLEVVAYALKIRQSHLLPPGAAPETQAAQADAWSAAIAYAALLHDVGKIAVDVEVSAVDGSRWYPWHGPLKNSYRFRYSKEREYRLHTAAAGLVYTQVLPRAVLDWMSTIPDLWASLIYVLAGQYEQAGIVGELVVQADRASVAQNLGGNPERALEAPINSLQRQLADGLRYVVSEQLKLNQSEASDGWLTNDALWLVSKTVADKLRAYLLSQGVEGIPNSNPSFFNQLQDHALIQPNKDGKGIWKAAVVNGTWQMTLTFLKVAPVLIWPSGARPAAFTGTVTPEVAGQQSPSDLTETAASRAGARDSSMQSVPVAEMAAGDSQPGSAETDDVGMLLNMLGMPDAELPQTTASPHIEDPNLPTCVADASVTSVGPVEISTNAIKPDVDPTKLGSEFMRWLRQGVNEHRIIINDARTKVHTVAGTAFLVTPQLFQRFAQEHPGIETPAKLAGTTGWRLVQRAFEKLAVHQKREDGLNIWVCEIKGPRKCRHLKGYLLKDPSSLFASVPYNNPYLGLLRLSGIEE